MKSFNGLLAFNFSRKRIVLSEEYLLDSIILIVKLNDWKFSEFYCMKLSLQSHILNDDELY